MTEQYSNILKALSTAPQIGQPAVPASGLSVEQQAENYNTFSELMKQGIHLPTLMKRIEEMEGEIKTLKTQPRHDANAELLAVMEAAVKNVPEVKVARQKVADVKSAIINEMCMKDPRYTEAVNEYKTVINAAYIRQKEQASDRGAAPEVRDEPGGCEAYQESVQGD